MKSTHLSNRSDMAKQQNTTKPSVPEKRDTKSTKAGKYFGLADEQLISAYKFMTLARSIDHKAMNLLKQGKTFFYIAGGGHEAIQVAVALQLNAKTDWIFPYYRDLAISLASGISTTDIFYQLFSRVNDPSSGGRQLPNHWGYTKELNIPSQSSPTGTQFLQAVGTALASKKTGKKSITYVSSGEGTTSQGEFHEAVNWASREKLPVLFVIQNNKYAISVPVNNQSGGKDSSIAEMMSGFENLKRFRIDGTHYLESYAAVKEAVDYINAGNGPALIEAEVVRLAAHSSSDDQKKYRDMNELEEDKKRDPILRFENQLLSDGIITEADITTITADILNEIDVAVEKAIAASEPVVSTSTDYVFDESGFADSLDYESSVPSGAPIVMVDAINHALHEEMKENDTIYIFGEDIADGKGGVFTATKGLSTKYGSERVFNSPLAEASIVGVATGMSLAGLKPVVEIQFGDYIWPAFMQYKCEVATFRYRSNNNWEVPFVTRVAVGGYIHGGLYHSQNIESIFAHVPGIMIAFPSNAADAKGLLKTAMRIKDPVIFCEHKGLYRQSYAITPEPDANYLVPFGKAKVVREGADITVVTYGLCVWDAVLVAKKLEEKGISVEVVDLRTIIPLDEETIYTSVRKTNKVLVLHEDTLTAGIGAEIAARIGENCFRFLDAPVKRLAAKDSHIPYNPALEADVLPSRDAVLKAIVELYQY